MCFSVDKQKTSIQDVLKDLCVLMCVICRLVVFSVFVAVNSCRRYVCFDVHDL